jgi:hypothetical protein
MRVIGARGDRHAEAGQRVADRCDPELLPVLGDELADQRDSAAVLAVVDSQDNGDDEDRRPVTDLLIVPP